MNYRGFLKWTVSMFSTATCTVLILSCFSCARGPFSMDQKDTVTANNIANTSNPYETAAFQILQTNCTSCHTATSGPKNVYNLLNTQSLINSALVLPGQPLNSLLYNSIQTNSMPPSGPLSDADKLTLSNWISKM